MKKEKETPLRISDQSLSVAQWFSDVDNDGGERALD